MQLDETGSRGHYDLVVLNPDFMRNHSVDEIIAEDFKKCCVSEEHHLLTAIEFKFIVSSLNKHVREEIAKDIIKLTWALELKQARNVYMVIFNRFRSEVSYYKELEKLSDANPQVKVIMSSQPKEQSVITKFLT